MVGNHSGIVRTIVRRFVPFSVYMIRGLIFCAGTKSILFCLSPAPLFRDVWAWAGHDVLVLLSSVNFDLQTGPVFHTLTVENCTLVNVLLIYASCYSGF